MYMPKQKLKMPAAGLRAVIAIAAAVAWYFAYKVKTPSIRWALTSAVQKARFCGFPVDMETLLQQCL